MGLRLRGKVLPDDETLVMAIVNRTPDSFYDRGLTYALDRALDRVDEVAPDEELRRVVELVGLVRERHPALVISVDTYRATVADAVCRAGADLINDAWGQPEPRTAEVAAEHGAGLVCTHAGGLPPRTLLHRSAY